MILLDIFIENEKLRKEWAADLNNDRLLYLAGSSNKKVWWRCEKGHEWQASVISRVYLESHCPVCSNMKIVPGINDLATLSPEVAAQWHPKLNGKLTPEMVGKGSAKKVWWRCDKGHEWQTQVLVRASQGSGCPYCAGRKPIPGVNDFATLYPELAKEWHPTLNGDLKPSDVGPGSSKKVWWRCDKGHEWQAIVQNRRVGGRACPTCNPRRKSSKPPKTIIYRDSIAKDPIVQRELAP